MSVGSWATRHELALFFVLAFALSWAAAGAGNRRS